MQYYHNLIIEKSFEFLKSLKKEINFILIGGWAVFFWTGALKSKDIDLVLEYEDLEKLKAKFPVLKNERLKKYEIKKEGIDIDIYLPFFSDPGIPAENIKDYIVKKEGFLLPVPELLLILKQSAFKERQYSLKGEKDKIDIFSLLILEDFDFRRYFEITKKFKKGFLGKDLEKLLKTTFEVPELNLTRHKFSKLKAKILTKLKNFAK